MDEDDRRERLGAFPKRLERRVVEFASARDGADLDARQTILAHGALERRTGCVGILERHRAERGKAIRPRAHDGGQRLVLFARELRADVRRRFVAVTDRDR